MKQSRGGMRQVVEGLPLALGLGFALLLLTAAQAAAAFHETAPRFTNLFETLNLRVAGTPLGAQVAHFVGAQLALHAGFAVLVWLLALATERAWPSCRGHRGKVICAWMGFGVVYVLAGNAAQYPWSETGLHWSVLQEAVIGPARIFDALTIILLLFVGLLVTRLALASSRVRALLPRAFAYGSVLATAAFTLHVVRANDPGETPVATEGRPNLILIGIDSLRGDAVGEHRGLGLTPNIDAFLRDGAHQFADAITPIARTYPSWISILSGRYPRSTGARENLMSRSSLRSFETLPEVLRKHGYSSLFAMDEVRFANIDTSYGFDRVLSPSMGVADFLLGTANDLPLSNLVSNTVLGRWLFPFSYANRGAHHTYRPSTFVEWLEREIEPGKQQMLAIHLTLPHWPYTWAEPDDEVFSRGADRQYRYAAAVIAADEQFGQIMSMLESRGLLANAVVVLFSDHGEALGIPTTDLMLRAAEAREVLGAKFVNIWGHGTSVLSPHQYQVVLAMRGYGPAEFPLAARVHDAPAALVDIAPTLLDLAGVKSDHSFDGVSLRPVLTGDEQYAEHLLSRPRFTETGFRTPLLNAKEIDERSLLEGAAQFFEMNPSSARLEIRSDILPRLIADKERAALTSRWLLAALPVSLDGQTHKYVLIDRDEGSGRRLTEAPGTTEDPEVRRLWEALHEHYGEELLPPAR